MWRSKWTMPIRLDVHWAMPRTQGKPIDPVWFNRARTAQRHLYRERAELLADGSGWHRRNKMKDALIDILRARHDPAVWAELLAEARACTEAEDL